MKQEIVATICLAITLTGLAGAVSIGNSSEYVSLFQSFVNEDLIPQVANNTTEAWSFAQTGMVGGFDYSDVADMTNSRGDGFGGKLVQVGKKPVGPGHYVQGTTNYIQP